MFLDDLTVEKFTSRIESFYDRFVRRNGVSAVQKLVEIVRAVTSAPDAAAVGGGRFIEG
jgi:hypothetical protein